MKQIKCQSCDGHYVIRSGKFGDFAGCSSYPKCKSTLKIHEFVFEYMKNYGVNIYAWDKVCWKCSKNTKVYSYYLNYDLSELDDYFENFGNVGLGDIASIDKLLAAKYTNIGTQFSKTIEDSYIANTCVHCKALQGKNYVVDDPHEIMDELMYERDMEKYLVENIPFQKVSISLNEIKTIFTIE